MDASLSPPLVRKGKTSTSAVSYDAQKNMKGTLKRCLSCGDASSSSSTLRPCLHAVCQLCFTGLLNITGEKPLECPTCRQSVTGFVPPSNHSAKSVGLLHTPAVSAVADHFRNLPSPHKNAGPKPSFQLNPTVIRIDNVPWVNLIDLFLLYESH